MSKKNTQARVWDSRGRGSWYGWDDYGDVTHVSAAESHAHRYPFSYSLIETRWEGHETTFTHEVVKKIEYGVTPKRGDDERQG